MEAAEPGRERGEREQAESLASEAGPLVLSLGLRWTLSFDVVSPSAESKPMTYMGATRGSTSPSPPAERSASLTGSGLLLIAGLGTPLTGTLVAVIEIWRILTMDEDPLVCLLAGTIGGALAMLGPGRWSVDAQLFGWKRIEAPPRRSSSNVP
jgi:hypothetical protein